MMVEIIPIIFNAYCMLIGTIVFLTYMLFYNFEDPKEPSNLGSKGYVILMLFFYAFNAIVLFVL